MKLRVLVDFDGTAVPDDVTDRILASFCDPEWLAVEADWKAGRISGHDCMRLQVDLMRATPQRLAETIREHDFDPDFAEFVEKCRIHDVDVVIVSEGFDVTIETLLGRAGLSLPFHANRLEWIGGDRWRLAFPNLNSDCGGQLGNCKCRQIAAGARRTVAIGDGRSDFCLAGSVDFVLAKGALTHECARRGWRYLAVTGFADINRQFNAWTMQALMAPRHQTLLPRTRADRSRDISNRPTQFH